MTERTFRDPSPSRNTPSGYRGDDPPPVPALPKGYISPPPLPTKSNRRAASVEPPERVLSPPPRLPPGRGVSLDRGPGVMPSQLKARTQPKRPPISPSGGADHGQGKDSVNFSRPMSPASSRPTSPLGEQCVAPPQNQVPKHQVSSNAANVGGLRDSEAESIQYYLAETAQAPVKRKKQKVPKNTEGSYLASGGSGGRATRTTLGLNSQRQQPSIESDPLPANFSSQASDSEMTAKPLPKKKKKKVPSDESQLGEPAYGFYPSDTDSVVSDRSNVTDRPRTYSTRAAGLLAKQPSIVREDREAEEQEDYPSQDKSAQNGSTVKSTITRQPKASANGKAGAHALDQSSQVSKHTKAISLDIPNANHTNIHGGFVNDVQPTRHQSLSPARAAHFSAQPILETPDSLKHQPPARSLSPAKSALKHSPSRGPSPVTGLSMVGNRRLGPGSEASDTTSMVSDDGSKSVPKKKRSVRVSFDSEPVIVGQATTPPTDPDSPMVMSSQNRDASTRRWLGLGNDKDHSTQRPSKDQDTSIQPTPILPSFGSVRGHSQQQPTSESARNLPEGSIAAADLGASSDQRVGSILSRVFGSEEISHASQTPKSRISSGPVPPEATTVEGTGYQSESEHSALSDQRQKPQLLGPGIAETIVREHVPSPQDPAQAQTVTGTEKSVEQNDNQVPPSIAVQPATPGLGDTPSIAVQPATPGLDEASKARDQYWFDMPGGFPSVTDDSANGVHADPVTVDHMLPEPTPAAIGIAEPEAVGSQHRPGTPIVGEVAEGLRTETGPDASEESDDTNNSIYSDAAEDLSDLEGDGFGSINAIVESPASPHLGLAGGNQPESPTKRTSNATNLRPSPLSRNESELSEPGSEAGWNKTQAYWSGLTQSQKQQIERAAAQNDIADALDAPKETKLKPKKRKIVPKKLIDGRFLPSSDQEYLGETGRPASPKAPLKSKMPAMKSSMREIPTESHQETHMRSSMRGAGPAKSSVRALLPPEPLPETRGALRKQNRPSSAVASPEYNKPLAKATPNGHDRSVSLGSPQKNAMPGLASNLKTKAPLTKPMRRTVSNGSDSSSSFKKTRPRASDNGRYTMKRSMRGSSVDEKPASAHGRASSMTARTLSPAEATRRPFSSVGPSMRSSMRDSVDLSKPSRTKSPSRFPGFGKSSRPKAAAKGPTSRFSSRFADSSDEDDGPSNRRSRFRDSSDEDEPAGLTPVRGIPRRIDDGDSTDLEDSSADEKAAPKSKPQQSNLEGAALGAGSLRAIPEAGDSPTASMGTGLQAKRAAEKEKKKRSFFGGLGSKKTPKAESLPLSTSGEAFQQEPLSTKQGLTLGASTPKAPESPHSPKHQRVLNPGSPMADTETATNTQKSPKSPKLQRRISAQQAEKIQMKRGISDSWPLPQSPGGISTPTMRPTTSDGTPKMKSGAIGASGLSNEVRAVRPELADRTNTVETTATGATGTAKKKKGWFKKAFRL